MLTFHYIHYLYSQGFMGYWEEIVLFCDGVAIITLPYAFKQISCVILALPAEAHNIVVNQIILILL